MLPETGFMIFFCLTDSVEVMQLFFRGKNVKKKKNEKKMKKQNKYFATLTFARKKKCSFCKLFI